MPITRILFAMFVGWVLGTTVSFQNAAAGAEQSPAEAEKRAIYLIGLLASKNAAPTVKGDASEGDDQIVSFDATYNKPAQVAVYLAAQQLLAEDEYVIDLLLQHLDDKRYAYSINSYYDNNVTVGEACARIVEMKLNSFVPELVRITRSGPDSRYEALDAYWQQNKKRGLAALQIESLDDWIAFYEKATTDTALPVHPDAPPLPAEKFEAGKARNLRTLRAIRNTIVQTGRPYPAKTLDTSTQCFFGLPWTGRKFNK